MLGTRVAVVCSVAALVLVGVGCGGDDDDSSSGTTKSEFIKKADAVCKDFNVQIQKSVEDLPEDTSQSDVAQFTLDTAVPLFRDQLDKLRDLDVPAADADRVEQMWDDLDAGTDELEQKLKDDPAGAFSEDYDPFGDVNKALNEYGLKECGG
jgi:hypothetical protein